MAVTGYTIPRSPEGRSSLVPYPPWHYVGDFLVVEYWADPEKAVSCLPEGARPAPRRRPLRGRLRRLAVVLGERRRARRPVALAVQGGVPRRQRAPRRRGGDDVPVHLGRPRLRAHARLAAGLPEEARLDLDHAHVRPREPRRPRREGRARRSAAPAPPTSGASRRRRSRSSGSRRRGRRTTTRRSSTSVTSRGSRPDATTTRPSTSSPRSRSRDRVLSPVWEGSATLELFGAPHEEHDLLAPVRIGKGFRFTFGYTVDDLETVKDLRA